MNFINDGLGNLHVQQQQQQYPSPPHPSAAAQAAAYSPAHSPVPPTAAEPPQLWGVVAPGRPVMTNFQQIEPTKWMAELAQPGSVPEVAFFLLPSALAQMPEGSGAVLYYAVAPHYALWNLVGTLTRDSPSGVFRTGWPTNEQVVASPVLRLGVAVESRDVVENLQSAKCANSAQSRLRWGRRVAQDLYHYLQSYARPAAAAAAATAGRAEEFLVMPVNVLDRWMQRFEAKYKRDPNFLLKTQQ